MKYRKDVIGVLLLFIATFFWGTTFISGKVLVSEISVSSLLLYRVLISCLVMGLIFTRTLIAELLDAFKCKQVWMFSIVGALSTIVQTEALKSALASHVAFIASLFVIFVPLIEYIFFGKRFKKIFYLAVFFSIFGIYLISYGFAIPESFTGFNFFALLSAIGYAYYLILLERIAGRFSSSTLIFHFFFVMGVLCFFYCVFNADFGRWEVLTKPVVFLNIASLALIGGILPYMLMVTGQKIIPAHFATLIYNFEPVFATILACAILGETLYVSAIAGCVAIFVSITIGAKGK